MDEMLWHDHQVIKRTERWFKPVKDMRRRLE